MVGEEASSSYRWTREQEKAFEDALASYPEDFGDSWEEIAGAVPGKSMEEVKMHYELLVEDVQNIEAGRVPLPNYVLDGSGEDMGGGRKGGHAHGDSHHGSKGSRADQERRKGIAWTEEEHRLFLLGLDKYGKGDWRSISRNYVISRTPTQVASHAQKYFNRLTSTNKDRRRSSIHDITSVGDGDVPASQGPITNQPNGLPISPGRSGRHPPHPPIGAPGVGVYTIGQPVGPSMGTPVSLPISATPHMAYGVRAPVGGGVVPGAPVHLYPMPRVPTHR